jgi:hypothetical protein
MHLPTILVAVALLLPWSIYAIDADVELGRQWAKCSKEAQLLQVVSKNPTQVDALRKTAALFHAYAIAAAGESVASQERDNIEATFLQGASQEDAARKTEFLRTFYQQAEEASKTCTGSFSQHGQRFKGRVQELLQRPMQPKT